MRRVLDSIWKPTLAIVVLSSLPLLLILATITPYGRIGAAKWTAIVAGSAAVATALTWWLLVGRRARPERVSGAAAGALAGFSAYFIPLVVWAMELWKHSANAELDALMFPMIALGILAAAMVLAGIGAAVGASMVPSETVTGDAANAASPGPGNGQVGDT